MNPSLRSIWIVVLAVLVLACAEDDPLPLATVDFKTDPAVVEVGLPVMFDNLSLNADRYEWRFGTQTSTDISPTITFSSPGSIDVVLKAFTKDNQVDSVVKTISVKQRYLTGYSITIYPTKDENGDDWDAGAADPADFFPDIIVQFIPDRDFEEDEILIDGPFENVDIPAFSVSLPDQAQIVLTNDEWAFTIFDFDEDDPATPEDETDFVPMAGFSGFNPVLANTIKNSAGDQGLITIFFPEDDVNPPFGVDFFFEIR